ncbi:MAG TPA: ribosome biogenesis GTPase YlqF [Geopsychrobacteraceae bacterium]|nr:ribosome biogenesis GTPase YlqF [Geopsychrobacteraceae bacterium]
MIIDWYPGHMKKAKQQIIDVLPSIDVFIEILDARLPLSSSNPTLESLRRDKPCVKVLNKNDLADPTVTKEWVRYFEQQKGVRALPIEARQHQDVARIIKLCRILAPNRGKPGRSLRAMVVGIPNVGKSTLINTLAGRKIARVGDKPAITTCPQQIDLRNGILLSDTPGLLWPVMDNPAGASRLATSGAIGDSAIDFIGVAQFAMNFMLDKYPDTVVKRYKFKEPPGNAMAGLEEVGRRRGCLVSGGEIDLHRAAEIFLRELRSGTLGQVSLETPEDVAKVERDDEIGTV